MWFILLLSIFLSQPCASTAQESSTAPTVEVSPSPKPTSSIDPVFALFEQYKNDQKYQHGLYQQAYLEYTQKKQTHTKYGTLTTKQEKIDATKKALIARNNTLKAYLVALRVDLDKYKKADPTTTEKYQIDISKWESWFDEQNSLVSAFSNEEDISAWAQNFKTKYIGIQQLIYTSLIINESNFKSLTLQKILSLSDQIKSAPQNTSLDWIGNITIKSDLFNQTLKNAFSATQIKQTSQRFNNFYPTAQKEITKANQYLLDLNSDLKAVVIKFDQ